VGHRAHGRRHPRRHGDPGHPPPPLTQRVATPSASHGGTSGPAEGSRVRRPSVAGQRSTQRVRRRLGQQCRRPEQLRDRHRLLGGGLPGGAVALHGRQDHEGQGDGEGRAEDAEDGGAQVRVGELSRDLASDGVPVCEGKVPASVGRYRTPQQEIERQRNAESGAALRACMTRTGMTRDECIADAKAGNAS